MTDAVTPVLPHADRPAAWNSARSAVRVPLALGLFGFLVSFAWSWRPSYWGDEAASVMSAERSFADLFRMLGNVDAVHGAYYVVLHVWIDLFGASELSTRLPSALAVGAATAGTVVLARSLGNARLAVVAGTVFAVLPRVTYMGAEARSTAMATMLAVWTMVTLVWLLRRPHRRRLPLLWGLYALGLAAGFYIFLYLVLLIPVHALVVIALTRRRPDRLKALWAWLGATVAASAAAAPVLVWGVAQREQISFLSRRPVADVVTAAVEQWFLGMPLAVVAWLLILFGVAVVVLRRRRATAPGDSGSVGLGVSLGVALAWMLVPTAILLGGSHVIAPMYSLRYLSFCTPAVAIAVAVGVVALEYRWLRGLAVALILATLLPSYIAQRGDFAKNGGSDWRHAADVLAARAAPGDAVVFDETGLPSRRPRLAMHLYPDAFSGLADVTLAQHYERTDSLWDTTVPLEARISALAGTSRIWLLRDGAEVDSTRGADVRVLRQQGFSVQRTILVNRTTITEMTR